MFGTWWKQRIERLEHLVEDLTGGGGGSGGGSFFKQLGNSFGALGVLGTKDNFGLRIITNNVACFLFDTAGNLVPPAANTGQIGTNALPFLLVRAQTITSGDHEFQTADGSAHITVKETRDGLFLLNHITGSREKIVTRPAEDHEWPTSTFAKNLAPAHQHLLDTVIAPAIAAADASRAEIVAKADAAITALSSDLAATQATHEELRAKLRATIAALAAVDEQIPKQLGDHLATLGNHLGASEEAVDRLGAAIVDHLEAARLATEQAVNINGTAQKIPDYDA